MGREERREAVQNKLKNNKTMNIHPQILKVHLSKDYIEERMDIIHAFNALTK